jgi:hypothetical protein
MGGPDLPARPFLFVSSFLACGVNLIAQSRWLFATIIFRSSLKLSARATAFDRRFQSPSVSQIDLGGKRREFIVQSFSVDGIDAGNRGIGLWAGVGRSGEDT